VRWEGTEELRERELEYVAEKADDGPVREARDAAVRDISGGDRRSDPEAPQGDNGAPKPVG
jgi:hypothetical protein